MVTQFILYACPTGQLADQIDAYFEKVKTDYSWNPALNYMPHCSLTGFFHDHTTAAQHYTLVLDDILARMRPLQPDPLMQVTGMIFRSDFHGFTLQSSWLSHLSETFSAATCSETRHDAIRVKEWLHLSLAYQFKSHEHEALKAMALRQINPGAPVGWDLRFYQRHEESQWTCHGCWSLSKSSHRLV
jgi:ubiquitin-associated SH3 domain-containing protein